MSSFIGRSVHDYQIDHVPRSLLQHTTTHSNSSPTSQLVSAQSEKYKLNSILGYQYNHLHPDVLFFRRFALQHVPTHSLPSLTCCSAASLITIPLPRVVTPNHDK